MATYKTSEYDAKIENLPNDAVRVTITVKRYSGTQDTYCHILKKEGRSITYYRTTFFYEALEALDKKGYRMQPYL